MSGISNFEIGRVSFFIGQKTLTDHNFKWLRQCGLRSTRANDPLCIDRVGRNQTLDFYWIIWIDPVETAKRLVAKIFVIRRVFYWVGSLETSRSAIYFAYLTYLIYYAYLTCYAYLTYYTDFQEGNVFKCEPAPACHRMHAIDLGVIVTLIKAMMWKFYECVEIFLDKEGLAAFKLEKQFKNILATTTGLDNQRWVFCIFLYICHILHILNSMHIWHILNIWHILCIFCILCILSILCIYCIFCILWKHLLSKVALKRADSKSGQIMCGITSFFFFLLWSPKQTAASDSLIVPSFPCWKNTTVLECQVISPNNNKNHFSTKAQVLFTRVHKCSLAEYDNFRYIVHIWHILHIIM